MIDYLVNDLISTSQASIDAAAPASVEDVRARAEPLLTFSAEVQAEHLELKRYLRQHLYRHYRVLRMTTKARRVVRELFNALLEDVDLMPTEHKGYRTTFISVDNKGKFDMDAFSDAINDDTAVVSIMYANNETGVIFPVEEIGKILKERKILFHTDAVQAVGKLQIDVKKLPVDMLSLSGHKLHAPKGIGALYVRKGTRFYPYIIGGHQENGSRAGTENVASIIGLGKACELAAENLENEIPYLSRLRDKLEGNLLKCCPDVRINGNTENRLPNTTNISFEYVEGEAILLRLNEYGICASSGSACTSGSLEPSRVLRAMKAISVTGGGSGTGIAALVNRKCDIANSSRGIPSPSSRLYDNLYGSSAIKARKAKIKAT